eukprot:748002-Hanusia_phi.AAC.4
MNALSSLDPALPAFVRVLSGICALISDTEVPSIGRPRHPTPIPPYLQLTPSSTLQWGTLYHPTLV